MTAPESSAKLALSVVRPPTAIPVRVAESLTAPATTETFHVTVIGCPPPPGPRTTSCVLPIFFPTNTPVVGSNDPSDVSVRLQVRRASGTAVLSAASA